MRGRPLAWLTVIVRTGGTAHDPCIRIQNPGPGDLFIQSVRAYPQNPPIYGVAEDRSLTAITGAIRKVDVNVLLRSGEKHDLAIIDRRNEADVRKDAFQRVHFFIYWRKTSSSWLWQPPVWRLTSTRDIQRIRAATVP